MTSLRSATNAPSVHVYIDFALPQGNVTVGDLRAFALAMLKVMDHPNSHVDNEGEIVVDCQNDVTLRVPAWLPVDDLGAENGRLEGL